MNNCVIEKIPESDKSWRNYSLIGRNFTTSRNLNVRFLLTRKFLGQFSQLFRIWKIHRNMENRIPRCIFPFPSYSS